MKKMAIKNKTVQTLGEVKEILENLDKDQKEENARIKETLVYIKNFIKAKPEKAKEIKKALEELDIIKLNQKHIAKIVDLMPEDIEDLRKIVSAEGINLEQDEINTILETVKKH